MVSYGYSEHLCGYDARQRLSQIGDNIQPSLRLDSVEKRIRNITDMRAQHFHSMRCERLRRQTSNPSMTGRIEEKHLLDHHLRDWAQLGKSDGGKLLGRRSTLGGIVVKDSYNIVVASHYPCM